MEIRNFFDISPALRSIHGGEGLAESRKLFGAEDFASGLRYLSRSELPPGASIGFHDHPEPREEIYFILSGEGVALDEHGAPRPVRAGDVILTRAGEAHGLRNDSAAPLCVFIFWAVVDQSRSSAA